MTDTTQNKPTCSRKQCCTIQYGEDAGVCMLDNCPCRTQNKPTCCFRCEKVETFSLAGKTTKTFGCADSACECHTTQTTPSEDWESRFDEKFVAGAMGGVVPIHRDGGQTLRRELIAFIRETAAAHYEKGVRDSLEVVEELYRELHPCGVHESERICNECENEKYNYAIASVLNTLKGRLLK